MRANRARRCVQRPAAPTPSRQLPAMLEHLLCRRSTKKRGWGVPATVLPSSGSRPVPAPARTPDREHARPAALHYADAAALERNLGAGTFGRPTDRHCGSCDQHTRAAPFLGKNRHSIRWQARVPDTGWERAEPRLKPGKDDDHPSVVHPQPRPDSGGARTDPECPATTQRL